MFKWQNVFRVFLAGIALCAVGVGVMYYRVKQRPTPSAGVEGATATYQAEEKGAKPSPSAETVTAAAGKGTSLTYQVQEAGATPEAAKPCAPIKSYDTSNKLIRRGQSATLSWHAPTVKSATITDLLSGAVTAVEVTGSISVTPATSRSYRLTTSDGGCSRTQDVTISVED